MVSANGLGSRVKPFISGSLTRSDATKHLFQNNFRTQVARYSSAERRHVWHEEPGTLMVTDPFAQQIQLAL